MVAHDHRGPRPLPSLLPAILSSRASSSKWPLSSVARGTPSHARDPDGERGGQATCSNSTPFGKMLEPPIYAAASNPLAARRYEDDGNVVSHGTLL